jgi:hypothetical protein
MKVFLNKIDNRIKSYNYNRKVEDFYIGRKNKQSSTISRVIDFLFIRVVILGGAFVWFAWRTGNLVLSIVLSLIVTILLSISLHLWKRRKLLSSRALKRRQIQREYLTERLAGLDSEEFKWQLMKILLKLPGIGVIKCRQHYLEIRLYGRKIAIGYHHGDPEEPVSPKQLSLWIRGVRVEDFHRVYFITSGEFKEGCRALAAGSRSLRLKLIDREGLIDLMEKTNLVPDEDTIDRLISKKINVPSNNRAAVKKEILTKKRIRTYLAYTLLFVVIASAVKVYSVYYYLLSALFLILAVITYIWNLKNSRADEDPDALFQPTCPESGNKAENII